MSSEPSTFLAEAPGEVLWSGRPEVRPQFGDLVAGGATWLAAAALLTLALGAPRGWNLAFAAPLGMAYGLVAAVAVFAARTVGAGRRLTSVCAFWGVVAAASAYTAQHGLALACPMTMVGALAAYLGARYRQNRGISYRITAEVAQLSEDGRYTLSFPIIAPPHLRPDLFGSSMGTVDFKPSEATLTTRDGKVFKVSAQPRRFRRLRQPELLVKAWTAARGAPDASPSTP
jgi:hypothetical protein